MHTMSTETKRIIGIVLGVAALLLIPLALTLLGSGVDGDGFHWTLSDFIIAGILLLVAGFTFNWAMSRFSRHRIIAGGIIMLVFLYVWAELAVGIFNFPGISGS
jgi:uncharacterized membrane protein YjjP (DUF1212 family)